MNSKIILVKLPSYLLMLVLSLSSATGAAASNYYDQDNVGKFGENLWAKACGWLPNVLPCAPDERPGFRWIETVPVRDDLSQNQVTQPLTTHPGSMTYQRVVAPGGMFRRFEQGPASTFSNRKHMAGDASAGQNLALIANIPADLLVVDSEIIWQIRSLRDGVERELYGRKLGLSLPDGPYAIRLRIDAYEERASVDVQHGKLAVPRFATNIGRLKASSETPANWEVVQMQGATPVRKIMGRADSYQISGVVPAGEYDVIATINDASRRSRVHVGLGQTALANLTVPTGRVNLVATLGNSPAMRPMSWKLFRLDGGRREVASPRRHAASLVVPPGQYEAIARLDGKERRREFTVMQGSNNSVVLAMD
ncbi:MAG: hypothetical protein KJ914_13245 [Gammaproteobacteria bacterium]|nr:hypothetical protein [Gammaproteobacteria bacterium]MBU1725402.1 hypothetical protein [Gammaproteobacteria bacterium]MBU2005272.1 hypothetical protein [Gammaproteobacteria bacterium]